MPRADAFEGEHVPGGQSPRHHLGTEGIEKVGVQLAAVVLPTHIYILLLLGSAYNDLIIKACCVIHRTEWGEIRWNHQRRRSSSWACPGPGFWLVNQYFRISVGQTIKTWSIMETVLSVVGLAMVLILDIFI
jgi:hypothetical protein